MQRASAPSTPSNSNGPPSKRVRLSNGTASPITPSAQQNAVQAALAAEEEKRIQALERHAADSGETRWVLSVQEQPRPQQSLDVVTAGFGDIDSLDHEEDSLFDKGDEDDDIAPGPTGRRIFGKMKRPVSSHEEESSEGSSSSSSESDEQDDDEHDPTEQFIRETRKAAAAQARSEKKAKRKAPQADDSPQHSKRVDLKELKSISGSGSISSGNRNARSPQVCFRCGKSGHIKADCPRGRS